MSDKDFEAMPMIGGRPMKLTDKQAAFCREYLRDLNATQAAIRAGYSKKTARQTGTENLSKPAVSTYISKLMAKRNERCEIDADYVLKEADQLYRLAKQELLTKFIPGLLGGTLKALELTGKHVDVQAFKDRLDVTTTVTMEDYVLKKAKERAGDEETSRVH